MTDYQYATSDAGVAKCRHDCGDRSGDDATRSRASRRRTWALFTVTRGGFPLNAITVNLGFGGPGTGFATAGLDYVAILRLRSPCPSASVRKTITVTPLANTNLQTPVIAQLKLVAGRELHRRQPKQRERRHLSVAHGAAARA